MPDISFSQLPSQQLRTDLTFGNFRWQTAEDQYKQGKFLDALCSTITYIDDAIGKQFALDPHTGVKVSHGSVQMYITVNNDQLQVLAPFTDITKAEKMIILRKICEINFNILNLASIKCKENTLCFTYSCPLAACEPWKIYDILREICLTADKYDDDFVVMHNATWVYEPDVKPFSDMRKEQSWKGCKLYLQEAKDWITYWKAEGFPYLVWDVIFITLMKIDHFCAPQGLIKNTMEINIDKLFEKRDINDVIYDGIGHLNMLDNLPQSAFDTQLYDAAIFIPVKVTGSADNLQTALKPYLEDGYNYITKGDSINAYLSLQKGIFRMLHYYRFNEAQWKQLESILAGNSNLQIAVAASKLYDQLNEFYSNPRDQSLTPAPDKKEDKKTLLAGWFN